MKDLGGFQTEFASNAVGQALTSGGSSIINPTQQPPSAELESITPSTTPYEGNIEGSAELESIASRVVTYNDEYMAKNASLSGWMQNKATKAAISSVGEYTEENPSAIDKELMAATQIQAKFQNLGAISAAERADIGALFGTGIGDAVGGGPIGALIGAGVGAITARSMGVVQSGEHQTQLAQQNMLGALSSTGILSEDGKFPFSDNLASVDPSVRLSNLSPVGGGIDRSLFEVDLTNPLTRRATSVARPLARYLTEGILGNIDNGDGKTTQNMEQTINMLVNMITADADNINMVYTRASKLAKKMGADEHTLRSFFDAHKHRIPPAEAKEIKKGLGNIYARY